MSAGNGDSDDKPRRVATVRPPETESARDAMTKLGSDIRILAIRRDQETLHGIGKAMYKLNETDAQALYDLLVAWAECQ